MQYLGGKFRTAKQIATILKLNREEGQMYFEPFVGAGWVLAEMDGVRMASDINPYLIAMYQELQKGWIPPENVPEDMYQWAKKGDGCPDYLRGFIGFGCSFAGKWFGGYARHDGSFNYAKVSKNSIMRVVDKFMGVSFSCDEFTQFVPNGLLIYCDPPYADTTPYDFCPAKFNTALFWETMRNWSQRNTVIISEYSCPDDFQCVFEIPTKTSIRDKSGNVIPRTERLFKYRGNR